MARRLTVNRDLCDSQAMCVSIAPKYFRMDDDDVMHVVDDSPSDEDLDLVRRAVRACPKAALTITEE